MKFQNTFCSQQRNSPTFEDFLLSNYETIETSPHIVVNNERKSETSSDVSQKEQPIPDKTREKRSSNRVRSERRHPSRHVSHRLHYIDNNEEKDKTNGHKHQSILEAPFVRMKEIHINPPRLPIKEDSKKFRLAESKKEEGNKLYKQKKYNEALKHYTAAIDLCPTMASYYGNRSACYMMVARYRLALEDSQKATKLDSTFVKGFLREAKCHLLFGDTVSAHRSLEAVKTLEPNNSSLAQEKKNLEILEKFIRDYQKYSEKKDYRTALFNIKKALEIATESSSLKLFKAECLVFLGKNGDAQEIVNDLLRMDSRNAEAIYIRGLALYYTDNVEKAFNHFQQVLVLNPDHEKAKKIYKTAKQLLSEKQKGNEALKDSQVEEAVQIYTKALEIDPLNSLTNAKLYFNRSIAYLKLNKLQEAIDDCSTAIKLDDNYTKAYLRRAKLYMDSEQYEDAVRDYETILKKEKTREHKQLLENAKLELKKSKRKDYYKLLGVPKNATEDEIKKAYKKRAMAHHPDRHTTSSDNEKKEHEKKFKEIGEAYAVLTDPKKRSRYDNGHDLDGNGMDYDIDPSNLFQAFWSTGGQGGFGHQSQGPFYQSYTHGGGGHSGHHFNFNNFPF